MAADVAFGSYEQAWLEAHPEYAIASAFLPDAARLTANAFGCLVEELDAARQLHDPHVATAKAAWWRGELAAALRGRASHPVTRVLFTKQLSGASEHESWLTLAEATQQTGIGACSTLPDAFAQHAAFHRAAAQVDAALHGHAQADVDHDAALWTISFLLHQLARGDADGERLSIPLDLLARHGLTRAQLSSASDQRNGLLRDYLGALAAASDAAFAAPRSSGLYRRVRARLDRQLIHSARAQPDPLSHVQAHLRAGRWPSLWAAWREARATNRGAR